MTAPACPGGGQPAPGRDDRAQVERELDDLAAHFHALLPRERAVVVGAIYARYSSDKQDSIADQVRALLEWAVTNRAFVPRDFIFYDTATRGAKVRRPGLDAARQVVEARRIGLFACFSTSRLFRKAYNALRFVEEQLVGRGIRAVFVKEGVDSADKRGWKLLYQIHAMTDELVGGTNADHIRAAHEGQFLRGQVCTTLALGYRGRELPGELTNRGRPTRVVEIDPEAAKYVAQVFSWFVHDGLSILEVARRLNADPDAPKSPKGSGPWTHTAVRILLANTRYRGLWAYGRTKATWQAEADYVRQVPRDEPLRQEQRDDLRIVDDATWWAAARKLELKHNGGGRKPRGGDPDTRPQLLRGLFVCPKHDQILYVGGAHGRMLYCRACQQTHKEQRPLFTMLNRALAHRLTCRALADRVRRDPALAADVIAHLRRAAAEAGDDAPGRLQKLEARRDAATAKITFFMKNLGESEADQRESAAQLAGLRRDRAGLEAELAALRAARDRTRDVPDDDQARALIGRIAEALQAASSQPGADDPRAREAIRLLTGGRIELEQCGQRRSHGGWLRGRIRLRLVAGLAAALGNPEAPDAGDPAELVIDYREPTTAELWADRVKALHDEGLLVAQIARRLGIRPPQAAQALKHWHDARGLPLPDGRTRRAAIENARKAGAAGGKPGLAPEPPRIRAAIEDANARGAAGGHPAPPA